MIFLCYTTDDGQLAVLHPAPGVSLERAARDIPPRPDGTARPFTVVHELPKDREFRGAWHLENGQLRVDLPKARVIQKHLWRRARQPQLARLDAESQQAEEAKDLPARARVLKRKQALRDVTLTDLEKCATLAEIKAAWPDVLRDPNPEPPPYGSIIAGRKGAAP